MPSLDGLRSEWELGFRGVEEKTSINLNLITVSKVWQLNVAQVVQLIEFSDVWSKDERSHPWIKGVRLCGWIVSGVLAVNIILTSVAAVLAYANNDAQSFLSATIYQGSCSVSKNWTTGLHFLINFLSTTMLAASNYCMQCLASPSRAEVDEAHRRHSWLSIGIPNVLNLLLLGKGRRRQLGFLLLLTSLPIHLIYNSAAYFGLAPSEYRVAMIQANQALELNRSLSHKADDEDCFKVLLDMDFSELSFPDLQELSEQECVDEFTEDYVHGHKALILVTSTVLPNDQSMLFIGAGHESDGYDEKGSEAQFSWMCHNQMNCTVDDLKDRVGNWSLYGRPLSTPTLHLSIPADSLPDLYKIDHCLSHRTEERCQLRFSPPICLVVISCNIVKILCMFLAARDDRDDILLTVGDAISSFLTRPDPATEGAGLLSMDYVKKGALGWHESYLESCSCELCDLKEQMQMQITIPRRVMKPKRWMRAASIKLWLGVLLMCASLLGVASFLLYLGVTDIHTHYSSRSIWDYGLGEVSTATLITGLNGSHTELDFVWMILIANTPQLLVSLTYFMYNALLSCMLLAAEYDDYATDRKLLRVSWPTGPQRSSYYLSLPYRYSIPLFLASAFLHWLVSQSLFFVEITPYDVRGVPSDDDKVMTCGYSPKALIFAMILGGVLVSAALLLGIRRLKSPMPLALHCSAAISAACHPGSEAGHALKPIQWGEVVVDSHNINRTNSDDEGVELERLSTISDFGPLFESGSEFEPNHESEAEPGAELSSEPETSSGAEYYHCSFTSGKVLKPDISRLYI
ncbi:hypothetical protein BJY04DRAFT_211669 [Aspergillus karnatakaensis]|uniref:uncharacterized protein n=1 Tax=Aspergillus karnatakaensis TaxID=1810916 RepID=UPI003CCE2CC0